MLGLPRESLTSLLGPRRRRGRWLDHPAGAAPLAKPWQHPEDLAKLYTGFSEAPNDHLTRLSICDDYHVGAQRQASSLVCRMVVRAEADRVARCLAVLWSEKRDGSQPAISRTRYCRLGRIRDEESSGYTIAELVLDRVLGRGDCAVLEYEVAMPRQTEESDEFSRRFTAPIRQYALSVTFHPDAADALPRVPATRGRQPGPLGRRAVAGRQRGADRRLGRPARSRRHPVGVGVTAIDLWGG